MTNVETIVAAMRRAPANVRFADVVKVCEHYFGPPRQRSTSHVVFKTPWPGDPRVNLQAGKGGQAKPYQVRQVVKAIDTLKGER